MHNIFSFLLLLLITLSLSGLSNTANGKSGDHKYVGTKLCAMCHKSETAGKQFVI